MKKVFKMVAFCLAVACVAPVFTACSDDDDKKETVANNADTAALKEELAACKALLGSATTEDYPQSAIDALQKVVTLVEESLKKDPTQTAVDNMLTQLTTAKTTFLAAAYDAIPAENIVCNWDFNTEGSVVTSTGTQKWTAELKAGPTELFGSNTDVPKFVEGKQGKALLFDNGAHLEVADYNTNALLTKEFTLSVWVKPTKTTAGNYIISLNYWNTFKFNLQGENKPFFTVNTDQGIVDADNEKAQSVKENEWAHLVVVMNFNDHTLKFYVNGNLDKTWDSTGKPALAGNNWAAGWTSVTGKKLPLMIGVCTTYEEALTWDWAVPSAETWDCFHGSIDELKIFNVALTDGQVSKLYNDEN